MRVWKMSLRNLCTAQTVNGDTNILTAGKDFVGGKDPVIWVEGTFGTATFQLQGRVNPNGGAWYNIGPVFRAPSQVKMEQKAVQIKGVIANAGGGTSITAYVR
jgi:hypothetical protein